MARVIPSGGQDQTALFVAREAAANDALARMYIMLQAKREDRDRMEAFRREMADTADSRWYERWNHAHPDANATSGDSPLASPGAAAYAPSRGGGGPIAKPLPGSDAPLSSDSFQIPGGAPALGNAPLSADKFSAADDPMNAMAQGSMENVPLSPKGQARASNKAGPTLTNLPRVAKKPAPQAGFVDIHPTILQQWHQAEVENKLPQGTLLTILGFENQGGRKYGKNPMSSANGWFQFTDALRDKYQLNEADTQDPVLMGRLAAHNLGQNRDMLTKLTKGGNNIQLGTSVGDIPFYTMLHQFGPGDGPRIVAAAKANPHMLMSDVMLQNLKNKDGTPRDNARVLVTNGIPSNATVGEFFKQHYGRIAPWMNRAVITEGKQPEGQTQAPQQNVGSDAVSFLQSRGPGANVRGLTPDVAVSLANAIQQAEAATGARARLTSGHRTYEEQAELRRRYESGSGGLAAPPGHSRHEQGNAGDVARGPVLEYLRRNPQILAAQGLEFLPGRAGQVDRVHIQRIRGYTPKAGTQFAGGAPANAPTDVSAQAAQPTRTPAKGVGKSAPDVTSGYGFQPSPSVSPIKAAADAIFAAPGTIKGGAPARTPTPAPAPAVAAPVAAPPTANVPMPPPRPIPGQNLGRSGAPQPEIPQLPTPMPMPRPRPPMPAPTLAPPADPYQTPTPQDAVPPAPLISKGDTGAAAAPLFNDDGDFLPPPVSALPPGATKEDNGDVTIPQPQPRPKGLGPQPNPQSLDMIDEMAGDTIPAYSGDVGADPFTSPPSNYTPPATRQADDQMMEGINQPQLLEQQQSDMPQELGMGAQLPPAPDTSFDTSAMDAIEPDAYPSIPTPWPEPQFKQSVRASPPDNKYDPGLSREARDAGMQRMLEKLKEVAGGAASGARKVAGIPFDPYDDPKKVADTEEKIGGDIREGAEDMLYNAGRSINRGYDAGARALSKMYTGAIPYAQGLYNNARGNTGAIQEAQEFKDKVFTGANPQGTSGFIVGSPESYGRGAGYVTRDMEANAALPPQHEQPTIPTKLSTPNVPNPVALPDYKPTGLRPIAPDAAGRGSIPNIPSVGEAGSAAFEALRAMRSRLPEGMIDKMKNAIFASGKPKVAAPINPNTPLVPRKVKTVGPNEDVDLQPFNIQAPGADKKVTGSPFSIEGGKAVAGPGEKLPEPPKKGEGGSKKKPRKVADPNSSTGYSYVVDD